MEPGGIADTRAVGGTFHGRARAIRIDVDDPLEQNSSADLESSKGALGWVPALEIGIASVCHEKVDQQVVAELAAWLATETGGVINLLGYLPLRESWPGRKCVWEVEDGDVGFREVPL